MHRALEILEIAEMVARHLQDKSALSFGLTSKNLIHVILNVLWGSRLRDTYQILQPFVATGAFESESKVERRGFSRSLDTSDWDRFLLYAGRIRHLYWIEHNVTQDVLRTLLENPAQRPLFPHLQHITILPDCLDDGALLAYTQLFISSLQSFAVEAPLGIPVSSDPANLPTLSLTTCLTSLAMNCPQLRKLQLRFEAESNGCTPSTLKKWSSILQKSYLMVFERLKNLEDVDLDLDLAHFDVLTHLARLPHLKNLRLWLAPDDSLTTRLLLPSVDLEAPFPCLENLVISVLGEALGPVILQQVAQLSKYSPLRSIDLSWDCRKSSTIKTILNTYSRHLKSQDSPLTALHLYYSSGNLPPNIQYDLSCHLTIHHLDALSASTFRNLTHLTITPPSGITLEDDDLYNIAHWMPKLVQLYLAPLETSEAEPLATLGGVLSLVKTCTGLEVLGASAVLTPLKDLPALGQTASWPRLYRWYVGKVTLNQPAEVAITLATLFPSLTILHGRSTPEGELKRIRGFLKKTFELRQSVADPGFLNNSILQSFWDDDDEDD